MGCLAAADGKTNPAGARQAAFFLLLKAPGSVSIGGCHDIDVVTRAERHIPVAHHGRAFHQQVIARLHGDVIAGKQSASFPGCAVFLNGVGRFLAEEPTFGLRLFTVVIITFRRGRQVHVPARSHANIPAGSHLRRFTVDVTSGDNRGVTAAGNFGALLAYGFIDNGFLFRVRTAASHGFFRQQVNVASGQDTDIPFRREACRLAGNIPPGHQRHVIAR